MLWSSLLLLAPLALASPLLKRWDDMQAKHAWTKVPSGWTAVGRPSADQKMVMRLGLKQHKLDELINSLYEVSDPSHVRYGQHLSKSEVNALVAPHVDTVEIVNAWLAHHGVDHTAVDRTDAGEWITMVVSVEQAERMLGAKYEVFNHTASADSVLRTLGYSLPRALHAHIDVVAPTTYFGTLHSMRATSFVEPDIAPAKPDYGTFKAVPAPAAAAPAPQATVPASCSSTITPACLIALYNTTGYTPKSTATNKLGVTGYLNEYANDADLQTFFRSYRADAVGSTFTHVQINGGKNDQSNPGVEANLDIQYTAALSYPTPNIYYSTGGSPPFTPDSQTQTNTNEPYLDWLNYVLAQSSVPQTFTTSYGDDEQTVPKDYATSVCNLLAQLGARGASIMFASGDFGVGGGDCRTNDGNNAVKFQPSFPASCPYVTTVGGTYKVPEVAVSFSGGGFSNYFARPSYQSTAVSSYLTSFGSTYSTYYNASGRAYPDVSAQGRAFAVVLGGRTTSVSGTSASSPAFAAVVSLLNDYRISLGKAPLGFLNPLIYSSAKAGFNDITSGSNPGCSTNGFSAKAGWDPVTGLGTPDFGKLQALVQNV